MFAEYGKAMPVILTVTLLFCVLVAVDNGMRSKAGHTADYGTVGGYRVGLAVLLSILVIAATFFLKQTPTVFWIVIQFLRESVLRLVLSQDSGKNGTESVKA